MKGVLTKKLSRLLVSSWRKKKERTVTVQCTPDKSTESILLQLKDLSQSHDNVTKLVLQDILQRSDNVQLFSVIQSLLLKDIDKTKRQKRGNNVQLKSIVLMEPHVRGQDYRRWSYKRTNFLHHIYRGAKNLNIDVQIEATLILELEPTSTEKDVASALAILQQQLPQDPDIKSLWLSIQDVPTVTSDLNSTSNHSKGNDNDNDGAGKSASTHRPSAIDLQQSPVQKIFSALIELFNSDTRHWQFIHCHIMYDPAEQNSTRQQDSGLFLLQDEQTNSLLEVAELYHIPLQVQWQPKRTYGGGEQSEYLSATSTHSTSCLQRQRKQPHSEELILHKGKSGGVDYLQDDVTASSTDHEFSSGALMLPTRP